MTAAGRARAAAHRETGPPFFIVFSLIRAPVICILNTGFLYRDDSNSAEPMMGGYFDVDIAGRAVDVQFHAPGPVKRAPLKSAGFAGDVYAPHGRAFPVKLALA